MHKYVQQLHTLNPQNGHEVVVLPRYDEPRVTFVVEITEDAKAAKYVGEPPEVEEIAFGEVLTRLRHDPGLLECQPGTVVRIEVDAARRQELTKLPSVCP